MKSWCWIILNLFLFKNCYLIRYANMEQHENRFKKSIMIHSIDYYSLYLKWSRKMHKNWSNLNIIVSLTCPIVNISQTFSCAFFCREQIKSNKMTEAFCKIFCSKYLNTIINLFFVASSIEKVEIFIKIYFNNRMLFVCDSCRHLVSESF